MVRYEAAKSRDLMTNCKKNETKKKERKKERKTEKKVVKKVEGRNPKY